MTREEIMTMDAEQLRVAIATAKGMEVGYEIKLFAEIKLGDPIPEPKKTPTYLYPALKYSDDSPMWIRLPEWTTDIAAAWELEEELPEDARLDYADRLAEIIELDGALDFQYWFYMAHATAEQRSRAWLIWKTEAE